MQRISLLLVASVALALCLAGESRAMMVSLHSSNTAITAFSFSEVSDTITTQELWSAPSLGVIEFVLDPTDVGTTFTVVRNITIDDDAVWSDFVSELLDPEGQLNDDLDLVPQPVDVPPGYTTSNNSDGIRFDTSVSPDSGGVFASAGLSVGLQDIVTFSGGPGASGTIQITYAFRDQRGPATPGDPFQAGSNDSLLIASQASASLPESGAMFWLTMLLVGTAFVRRG